MYTMHTNYFFGNKVSNYGIQHKRVDYATLAKAFDAVLNNDIMKKTYDIGYWEQESGFVDNENYIEDIKVKIEELEAEIEELEEDEEENNEEEIENLKDKIEELEEEIRELEEEQDDYAEIFQYYIVSDRGAEILKEINEIVFYNEELDMYIWGVTHWGTSWEYVLTDIEIIPYENEE